MIEAQNLTRRYGDFTAVRDISFSLAEGEIVGMLGPNGAGKTTTIRMITGFLPPTSGRVTVAGKDLVDAPHAAIEVDKVIGLADGLKALFDLLALLGQSLVLTAGRG